MNPVLMICALLVSAAAAESIRETETMDRRGFYDYESSGSLPDDEDIEESIEDSDYDEDSFDYESGSGDPVQYFNPSISCPIDHIHSTAETPTITMGNRIPEGNRDVKTTIHDNDLNNEILTDKKSNPVDLEPSNEILLPSTANESIFQRTEVVVALVAGALVGLLFAVFIIVAVIVRRKIPNGCDSVKKPIYTKTSTMEV
ncbi:syndecan 4-A-like [Spea bombifrons]|uniref:syndecan 4-A-like n=1 Tax=Spea bombifrons TaxID=233779 RepID=UPI0023490F71|nr:syndecan 4-A-like [Spea bombifrons]